MASATCKNKNMSQSKQNPDFPPKQSLTDSSMTHTQLIDSLTSHISLYHSNSHSPSPNPSPTRSSILKWFSSLTVHQRQAHLTAVDSKFVKILIQMLRKLQSHGHGSFIALPDLPSRDLPALCFRKSRGLLSRVAESDESKRLIFDSTRLFSSAEGEDITACSCSIESVDAVTVSEELVENLERFVGAMDGISNGGFLRGDESELGSDWVELEWLKEKGYYSLEAFVANRLEVALRLAWLNCNGVRKRGVKLKEKASVAGVAANMYWRKKGCVDWWANLDATTRRKVLTVALGKSAKALEHARGMVVGKAQTAARKSRKDKSKNKKSGFNNLVELGNFERSVMEESSFSVVSQDEAAKSGRASDNPTTHYATDDNTIGNNFFASGSSLSSSSVDVPTREASATQSIQGDYVNGSSESFCHIGSENSLCNNVVENQTIPSRLETLNCNGIPPAVPALEFDNVLSNEDINFQNSANRSECDVKSTFPDKPVQAFDVKEESVLVREQESLNSYDTEPSTSSERPPNEWPNVAPFYFPSANSLLPAATDRLHLDVGRHWHNHFQQSFLPSMHHARNSPTECGCNPVLSRPLPMSLDWPPMVRSACGLAPSVTCNYDSGCISRLQSTFPQSFTTQRFQLNAMTTDDERKYSGDLTDLLTNTKELADECDSHCISEEEVEVHAVSGIDYNQYFGGGVMYWNPSDHPGTGFSRPPSLSSDDSSWAWREADMVRAVDDMVAYSSSYSTNGLTSPTAASFNSTFDPLGPGHQALGYVIPGNEVPGKMLHSASTLADTVAEEEASGSLSTIPSDVEGKTGDSLPYPILRPINVPNMSRDRSRSEFKRSHEHKSPCFPPTRREQPRIKRPPSPVVLCVPRAPRPPPPSPVSDSRKQRGFPTVRSGSSSPRHWGVRGWYHDGNNLDEACLRVDGAEVVWPWRANNLSARPMIQPLPAALLQDRLIAMSQLARDQEHPDVAFPVQPPELQSCPTRKASLSLMHSLLHDEIDSFCKKVAEANMARKPYINWAVKRVTRSLQVLWPRSRTNIFGSNATGLSLPTSDVDIVVSLPPVRNLEPIKEAGILEGRNGIKETCLQHAARYLANQEWVKNDSLKTVENTAVPIIMLVVEVPHDLITSSASNVQSPKEEATHVTGGQGNNVQSETVVLEDAVLTKCTQINHTANDSKSVRIDISFKSSSHTGLQTTELVKELTEQFPAATPLAFVLKQFLADRSLDQSYSGGLSSYCLVLLITRFLQHEHHLGRPINQKFGSLLMDFLYFFGNVFDPRQMRISVQGSGVYMKRERGCSIDPIHVDDPLFSTNNVGRNCFRIHQCIKAFSEAYSVLENELTCIPEYGDTCPRSPCRLLPKIIPSIDLV
ncbi:uncharacterized protein LOC133879662 isoform X3 [Alnus glutinosa]|uniref:uncharacterized protein LOC133879662 isoform X3 n=1 Tax=Alnus glutinosa TaxID=3517 RepID=UPI002D79CF73|nr:uncharacterized protein LOC133879662 isoform X3 [Alnus glutinosa]